MVPPYFTMKDAFIASLRCNVRQTCGLLLFIRSPPGRLSAISFPSGLSAGEPLSLRGIKAYSSRSWGLYEESLKGTMPLQDSGNSIAVDEHLRVLFFVNSDDLLAIVITAILADAMGQLHLVALGAFHDSRKLQLPVGTTATATSLGYFSFGQSHNYTS